MDNEVWRPVKGWEAFYLVSNKGRVKSLDRKCKRGNGFALHEGQIMKQQDNSKRKTHAGFTWEFVPPDKLEGMMQAWDAASGHGHSR